MSYQTILYEIKDGAGRLTLNRPEKLNSFNEQMHEEVREVLSKIKTESVRALLITGAGRGFCAAPGKISEIVESRRATRASTSVQPSKNIMRRWCVRCGLCLSRSLPE